MNSTELFLPKLVKLAALLEEPLIIEDQIFKIGSMRIDTSAIPYEEQLEFVYDLMVEKMALRLK